MLDNPLNSETYDTENHFLSYTQNFQNISLISSRNQRCYAKECMTYKMLWFHKNTKNNWMM